MNGNSVRIRVDQTDQGLWRVYRRNYLGVHVEQWALVGVVERRGVTLTEYWVLRPKQSEGGGAFLWAEDGDEPFETFEQAVRHAAQWRI